MKRYLVLPWLFVLALGTAAANTTFDFTYTGSLYSASGTLSATDNGDGSFTALSGTGLYDGSAITLVANPSAPNASDILFNASWNVIYDNQLFPSAPSVLDMDGLLFSFDTTGPLGASLVSLCGTAGCDGFTPYGSILNDVNTTYDAGTFRLTAVPEPSTLAVVGLGLVGLATLKRRISRSGPRP